MLGRATVGVLGILLLVGCNGRQPAPVPAASVTAVVPSAKPVERGKVRDFSLACEPKEKARAAELLVRADARFSVQQRRADADVAAFVCLAAGSEELAVAAALDALAENHAAAVKAGLEARVEDLLRFRLVEASNLVRARAIQAAGAAVRGRQRSAKLRSQLAQQLENESDPKLVQELLVALRLARFAAPEPQLVARVLKLAEQGPVQNRAAALQVLARLSAEVAPEQLLAAATPASAEAEPLLRASALLPLAQIGKNDAAFSLLASAASDTAPCVRATAAHALGQSKQLRAVHALVPLLADAAAVSCELKGFGAADRSDGRLDIEGAREEVRLAALDAIEQAAGQTPAFVSQEKNLSPAAIARNVALVQAWYAKSKARLPAAHSVAPVSSR